MTTNNCEREIQLNRLDKIIERLENSSQQLHVIKDKIKLLKELRRYKYCRCYK